MLRMPVACQRPITMFAEILFKSNRNFLCLGSSGSFQAARQSNSDVPVNVNVQRDTLPVRFWGRLRLTIIRFLFLICHARHDTPEYLPFNKSICYFNLRQYWNIFNNKTIENNKCVLTRIYDDDNLLNTTKHHNRKRSYPNDHRGR